MPAVAKGTPGNLPSDLSAFVGRRRELEELRSLLTESRLVTLTGVGGVGKTRLALRVASTVRRAFPDGLWFVDLTELQDGALLAQEVHTPDTLAYLVITVLGMPQGAGPPLRQLTDLLADRQMLLVLDNCEHLLPASAMLADVPLRFCPGLRVLATSREPLAVRGEALYPVAPLATPDGAVHAADLDRNDSVALFLAQARATVPDFALTGANAAAIAELCRRLDGLPLAIELAAARVRALSPAQMLERLSSRFALLSRGPRNAPERQQALRACVEWSFALCSKPERLLWARASVFVGGFELDALEGACTDDRLPVDEVVDVIAGLIDKSIVERVGGQDGHARYRMLETLRDYGQEQLCRAGEQAMWRGRHRDWYERTATTAAAERISRRQTYWIARFTREHPNIRAAVEFCLTEPGQAEHALSVVTGLPWLYWWSRGVCSEGLIWLERALDQTGAATTTRVRALLLAAFLATWLGDTAVETSRLAEGERLARDLSDTPGLALAALIRGSAEQLRGNDLRVVAAFARRGLDILATLPRPDQERETTLRLQLLLQLGQAAALTGEHDRARRCFQEALSIAEHEGASVNEAWARWGLGLVSWRQGNTAVAAHRVRECLRFVKDQGLPDPLMAALCVEVLAWITAGRGQHQRAAVLLGAADRAQSYLGKPVLTTEALTAEHGRCTEQILAALGDAAFTEAFRRGRALRLGEAISHALGDHDEPVPAPPAASPLTRREREVAALVAQGLTNKEIAARLVIARRTAEGHVERILTKLGFTNRTQLAAWMAEHTSPQE
ncbi:tetratricopeptide repeat protein [Lentzea sp. NEAU-D13]|uniref:Tetratricopeptide repeat protein n=1 Tax=Lentzea alba TaxID=2714351 RepID=A0A7C9W1M4_9PSEU|nr:LuxR C-terminal-related transcriptional regulator [Lentzea alba]NGY64218.1 tetratricopeptide repeat protein [Lentzea alba]